MIKASELKKGQVVLYEGALYTVSDIQRVSKGNWRSYLQVKLKSLKDGRVLDARMSVDDRVDTPFVDTKPYQYLYRDGDHFVLMDPQTFDQVPASAEAMGDADKYLRGNEMITVSFIEGKIVAVELPNVVELKVVDTPPQVKRRDGDQPVQGGDAGNRSAGARAAVHRDGRGTAHRHAHGRVPRTREGVRA